MKAQKAVPLLRQRLQEALTRQDRSVLVVAGSGVSIQATENAPAASWKGLLQLGLQRCQREAMRWKKKEFNSNAVENHLSSKKIEDWISAASAIESTLRLAGGTVYGEWLAETVGALHPTKPEILRALGVLGVPIATTNYDGLLEHELDLHPMTWRTHDLVDQMLAGTYPVDTVLHLHGHWFEPQSVVLGSSSYASVLGDKRAQDTLRHLMHSRDLIFVGMGGGLDDPNFGALLNWAKDVILPSNRFHFLLVRRKDAPEMRARLTATTRIHVVDYGQDYAELAPFLHSLVDSVPLTSGPPSWLEDPGSKSVPISRNLVRRALFEMLRTDTDFDAFIADEFADSYKFFGAAMDRQQKVTLLLQRAGAEFVMARLRSWCKSPTSLTTPQEFLGHNRGVESSARSPEVRHKRPVVDVRFQADRTGISLAVWFRKIPIVIRIGVIAVLLIGGIGMMARWVVDRPSITVLENPPTLVGKQGTWSIGPDSPHYRCPDPGTIKSITKKEHGPLQMRWIADEHEPIKFIATLGNAQAIVTIHGNTDAPHCQHPIKLRFSSGTLSEMNLLKDALRLVLQEGTAPP